MNVININDILYLKSMIYHKEALLDEMCKEPAKENYTPIDRFRMAFQIQETQDKVETLIKKKRHGDDLYLCSVN